MGKIQEMQGSLQSQNGGQKFNLSFSSSGESGCNYATRQPENKNEVQQNNDALREHSNYSIDEPSHNRAAFNS